ncbi:CotH kinase family protein [Alkaliphilus sp. B6464]|uniref:CotH kinase family protein n=1 Tax=Alkaliphilus sp. B6464 TaxID=2731219 RepID=UPI001BA748B4|nr:CotH kinase family protein [Alkaliphilus sp. B6464]QUH19734.1 CotH kinase family protein [Alkaliphilus sp. B6464]
MLGNRHINLIIIILMIVTIIFTSIFILSPQSLGITPSSTTEVEYASRLFKKDEVAEISIKMKQEDWDWIIENALDEEYRSADITINGETFYNVGIRPKGNSSLRSVAQDDTTDRFSFKIKFDKYVKGQTYYGLDKFVINNMISDTTYMKEYLAYDLFEKMDIVTPLNSFTNININGEPWGLYLAVEATEESFLSRNFGNDYGSLYKPEDTGSSLKLADENHSSYQGIKDNAQIKITDKDFDKVVEMIKNLNSGTDLEKYLDVDEVLRYFAVNNLLVNLDSYVGNFNHNYLLYEKDGVFSILPWDLNMAFGGFQVRNGQQAVDFSINTPYSGNGENYPLISKLLEVPEYKEIYNKYLEEAVKLYFNSGLFKTTVTNLDNLINEYVKNDATAFYTYEQYTASLPVLKEFGKLRAKSVIAQLAGETTAGAVDLDLNALGSMGMGGAGGMAGPNRAGGGNNRDRPNNMGQPGNMPNDMGSENRLNNRNQDNMNMGNPPNVGNQENINRDNPPNNIQGGFMQDTINSENMEEIMEIIQTADGGELTDSQINKLKELGLDDTAIEFMKNIPSNMNLENFQNGPGRGGGFPGGDMGGGRNRSNTRNLIPSLIVTGVCTLIMILAIFFVYKFKRRKYIRGLAK